MKKLFALLLAVIMLCAMVACSQTPSEPANSDLVPTLEPEKTPDATPEPTQEQELYAPMDIFSNEFNPFGMDSPFTVFAASFNKNSETQEGNAQFVLSMTGSGNMFACVAYIADVSGLGLDENGKFTLLEEYRANGYFCEFTGSDGQIVTIRQANPDDDRYEYVEADGQHDFHGGGCVIDITYYVNDADIEKYTKLVRDNFSIDALSPIADYFDTSTDFSECGLGVNVHKNEARSYAVYYLPDVNAVQQSLQANGNGWWGEWNGMVQTAFMYNDIESKLTFDTECGAITVEQLNTNFNLPEGTLSYLGFGFDDAGTCGVYEQREPHYISVAIHRPEWGEHPDNWNIEFMDTDVNGYSLRITYHVDDGRYHVSVDKDGESCAYDAYTVKDEKGGEYPDIETVHRMFNAAFGTKEKELYYKPLEHFGQWVRERFGMSADELYALPIK